MCRLLASSSGSASPAKPSTLLAKSVATTMAVGREFAYANLPLTRSTRCRWTSPTLGRVILVMAEFALVMVLCFYKMHPNDEWEWEDMGYRTGFIALAQLPLVVLLAGKNNLVGFLIGSSYERLNWLHRWTARILFLTVTIHMIYWFRDWARYDFIPHKMTTDHITQRGFAAWCILLWIVLSSVAPIRRWSYEVFVIQHVVTFAGFLAAVYLHIPAEVKVWVWIPIGLAIFDRGARSLLVLYNNLSVFHPHSNRGGFWACKAIFEPLGPDMTRIIIHNPPRRWKTGQHVMLSCHSVVPLQSHPFTIASIPEDGRMEFLVKAKSGASKRFLGHAQKHQMLPLANGGASAEHLTTIAIEGPYGHIRPLRQFDSVVMIAGSSGGTFTVPLMRDIVASWKTADLRRDTRSTFRNPIGAVTRYIRFVWVVKSRQQLGWFAAQLNSVAQDVEQLNRDGYDAQVAMSVYITCDVLLDAEEKTLPRQTPPDDVHRTPEERSEPTIITTEKSEEFKKGAVSLRSVSISLGSQPACGPNGPCCCQTTIEDEDDQNSNPNRKCQCRCNAEPLERRSADSTDFSPRSSVASSILPASKKATAHAIAVHPAIAILSGRPQPENLIRKTVEQALGESAVVVCGPRGLVDDVRASVVSLSDERAVHKGTGAQGIYLHTEAFDY